MQFWEAAGKRKGHAANIEAGRSGMRCNKVPVILPSRRQRSLRKGAARLERQTSILLLALAWKIKAGKKKSPPEASSCERLRTHHMTGRLRAETAFTHAPSCGKQCDNGCLRPRGAAQTRWQKRDCVTR